MGNHSGPILCMFSFVLETARIISLCPNDSIHLAQVGKAVDQTILRQRDNSTRGICNQFLLGLWRRNKVEELLFRDERKDRNVWVCCFMWVVQYQNARPHYAHEGRGAQGKIGLSPYGSIDDGVNKELSNITIAFKRMNLTNCKVIAEPHQFWSIKYQERCDRTLPKIIIVFSRYQNRSSYTSGTPKGQKQFVARPNHQDETMLYHTVCLFGEDVVRNAECEMSLVAKGIKTCRMIKKYVHYVHLISPLDVDLSINRFWGIITETRTPRNTMLLFQNSSIISSIIIYPTYKLSAPPSLFI